MLLSDLRALIQKGEGATLEFKRDSVPPERLAKEIVAFANMNGGHILVGVEDDGDISGIEREDLQAWLMDTVIGRYVYPKLIPTYEELALDDKRIAIIEVPQGNAKPYVLKHNDREDIYVRYGNTSQLGEREQMARLFESGGLLSSELFPVHGSSIDDLDTRRYVEYFQNMLGFARETNWQNLLVDRSFLRNEKEPYRCSYLSYVLFAKQPSLRMPQAQARLTVYSGADKDYDTAYDEILDVPFVEYRGEYPSDNKPVEPALHDRLIERIKPYISREELSVGTRVRKWDYPQEAIRELIVNALVHRDWSKQNYVRIDVYNNRLEVISPGKLPNGMTVEKIKSGSQVLRNPQFVRVFRDYGYLEDQGMGIRLKVIPLMRKHNHSEPEFEVTDDYFKVTLRKK